jgi:hypothetical protein
MMNRLQNKRSWLVGGALGALLIIATAWFVLIGPKLSATSDLQTQTTQTKQDNVALQAKVSSLKQKSRLLGRYTAALRSASAALPADSGLPAFTRQLSGQAKADSVDVSAIMVAGVSAVTTAASTDPVPSTDTATDSSASATTSAPATAAGGLFQIQVTVTSRGTMAHQLAFLDDIRTTGPRRALITSIQLTPGVATSTAASTSAVTLTSQLTIFSAPRSAAEITELKKLLSGNIGN